MFDIGWTEMLVVACVAIIVVGPKDLPKMLRAFGKTMKSVRGLASDFQKQFDDAIKDADLDGVKDIATGKKFSPLEDIKKSVTDFEKDVKDQMSAKASETDDAMEAESKGLPQAVADKLGIDTGRAKPDPAKKADVKPAAKKAAAKPAAKKTAAKKSVSAKATTAKTVAAAKKPAAKATPKAGAKPTAKKPPQKASAVKAAKSA